MIFNWVRPKPEGRSNRSTGSVDLSWILGRLLPAVPRASSNVLDA